ncbi:hypothetical protein PGT21_020668 [Puccinia graminis f. sp. tritici]|uniref:Uncharacterized protein n=1 Tax=Puccinia graminis f. sp. tritici TaxID=56615 RepID=A0A5B0NLL3_PUCGR|nr:hypothetical protein PGT21_020668 [Puccinia graminis f. sp. tritici]
MAALITAMASYQRQPIGRQWDRPVTLAPQRRHLMSSRGRHLATPPSTPSNASIRRHQARGRQDEVDNGASAAASPDGAVIGRPGAETAGAPRLGVQLFFDSPGCLIDAKHHLLAILRSSIPLSFALRSRYMYQAAILTSCAYLFMFDVYNGSFSDVDYSYRLEFLSRSRYLLLSLKIILHQIYRLIQDTLQTLVDLHTKTHSVYNLLLCLCSDRHSCCWLWFSVWQLLLEQIGDALRIFLNRPASRSIIQET